MDSGGHAVRVDADDDWERPARVVVVNASGAVSGAEAVLLWVERGHFFLIDFDTYQEKGHPLQDFAHFETEIKFGLMDSEDELTYPFDLSAERMRVRQEDIRECAEGADDELVEILRKAIHNIRDFHEHQSHHPQPACAQGQPQRQIVLTLRRPRQQKAGYVRTYDQQQAPDRREQSP